MNLILNHKIAIKTTFLIAMAAVLVFAFSSGPPPGHTGDFGEPDCTACHEVYGTDGTFEIEGVPDQYTPGETYPITVRLSQDGQMRWGFQLATRFEEDGSQAGVIQVTDPDNTQIVEDFEGRGIMYIEHTEMGTFWGTEDGPVEWQFDWTAPNDGVGSVRFSAAGNAADGDESPRGDFIYLAQATSTPAEQK